MTGVQTCALPIYPVHDPVPIDPVPIHDIDPIDLMDIMVVITVVITGVGIGIHRGGMDLTEEGGIPHLDTGAVEQCLW